MSSVKVITFNCFRAGVALTAALFAFSVCGQSYPSKPVRLIVAFAPGGAADIVARTISTKLSEALGQTVFVDNRPGANGNIAAEVVVHAAPDGYTLLWGFPGLVTNPSLYRKLTYDPLRDLAPVTLIASTPVLLVANPGLPADSVRELIALAKAKPGQLNYGSAGNGASGHMAGELFRSMAGVDMQHVPYKGAAPALNDLMAGQLDIIFDSVVGSLPLVQSGKLKALAVAGAKRSEMLPNVPTFDESGLPGYDAGTWFGILAPAGTPPAIIARLRAESVKIITAPDIKARFSTLALDARGGSAEEFAAFMRNETAKWAKIIKSAGVRFD